MNGRHQAREWMKGVLPILVLGGLLFDVVALSRASEGEGSTEAGVSAAQGAPDPSVTGSQEKSSSQKRQAPRREAVPAAPPRDIKVAFKLDPRLTSGLHMGDHWVPTSSGFQEGKCTAEARAQGLGANGRPVRISPKWVPSDAEMVTVSPVEGSDVKITVQRDGQSKLMVVSPGVSRELSIKAAYQDNAIRVEISQ